jgi:phosphoglycerate kinase
MRFGIRTMDEVNVCGKTVLCRIDINQPVDKRTGSLKSITRIEAVAPTIRELADQGARIVLLAHQGSDIEYQNFYTTEPHAKILSEQVGKEVRFIPDVCGPAAIEAIRVLENGEILLLDNVRFLSEEQTLFEKSLKLTHAQMAETLLVRKLAPLADLYLCDAFAAAHRDQPSLCGFEQVLPSFMGRLFEKEYVVLSELMAAPKRPCTFVLGGAKIADAFLMMESVLKAGAADHILTGGVVANILLTAGGTQIGEGSRRWIETSGYAGFYEPARKLLDQYRERIVLPTDLAWLENGSRKEAAVTNIAPDAACADIGRETAERYQEYIRDAATVFVNGPMGIFEEEETEIGTGMVWEALGDTGAFTVVGGGDSITATTKYKKTEQISYICTGGGALIRFLSGEELPVVKALRHGSKLPVRESEEALV